MAKTESVKYRHLGVRLNLELLARLDKYVEYMQRKVDSSNMRGIKVNRSMAIRSLIEEYLDKDGIPLWPKNK